MGAQDLGNHEFLAIAPFLEGIHGDPLVNIIR
jgi:hypothetical protein